MIKKLLVLLIAITAGLTIVAAQPEITFRELIHDFGTFPEETGKVSHTFEFTNTGKNDLIIQNVKASCGCTAPNWTKTPIKPGETGTIEVVYNAANRPRAFSQSVTVTSNAKEARLTIKGNVVPKAARVEDQFPFDMNGLRARHQNVYLNNVEFPSSRTERVEVINTTQNPITLSFRGVPSFLTVKASPATLQANERGTIDITLDAKAANTLGTISQEFTVVINGEVVDDKRFRIRTFANIIEK